MKAKTILERLNPGTSAPVRLYPNPKIEMPNPINPLNHTMASDFMKSFRSNTIPDEKPPSDSIDIPLDRTNFLLIINTPAMANKTNPIRISPHSPMVGTMLRQLIPNSPMAKPAAAGGKVMVIDFNKHLEPVA